MFSANEGGFWCFKVVGCHRDELFTIFQQREKKFYRYLYGNGEADAGGTKCCQLDNFLINFNLSLHVLLPFFIL